MSILDVVQLDASKVKPECYAPAAEKLISGAPTQEVFAQYEAAGGKLSIGEWRCAAGAWRVSYDADEYEFCHLLEGRIRLVDEHGAAKEFVKGDAFVIPAGFRGVWETIEPCAKHYVICRV